MPPCIATLPLEWCGRLANTHLQSKRWVAGGERSRRPGDRRPPAGTRPRRGAATRERIMSSAADLFADGGYDATSVQAIAERAGITVATIYRHFRSKDELLIAVAKAALTTTDLAQLPSAGDDPVEQVTALVLAFARPDRYRTRRLAIELAEPRRATPRSPAPCATSTRRRAPARRGAGRRPDATGGSTPPPTRTVGPHDPPADHGPDPHRRPRRPPRRRRRLARVAAQRRPPPAQRALNAAVPRRRPGTGRSSVVGLPHAAERHLADARPS